MSIQDQDSLIIAAQKRRRLGVFILSGVVVTCLMIYLLWLFVVKGFQIAVLPEEVTDKSVVTVKHGTGFVIDKKVYLFGATANLAVSAPKFLTEEVILSGDSPSIVQVQLTPAPVSLTVTSQPQLDNVLWVVNGQMISEGKSLTSQVQPGVITVEARHPWYQSATLNLEAQAAEILQEELLLTPLEGELIFNSTPTGADIKINGKIVGKTPATITRTGGLYDVEIALSGYQVVQDNIDVSSRNLNPQRLYQLIPEKGELSINLVPKGGILLANNEPVSSPVLMDANSAHQVRYEKDGFKTYQTNITLAPEEQKQISIELQPEYGQVRLTTNLTAQVESNGKVLGTTPLTVSLQTFEQELSFSKPGYRTVVQKVKPDVNKTVALQAEMLSEFDARRAEGKPLFISGLGIEVKRFRPRSYTMGSPDNEAYRRRNEHRISVDFDRTIWVSKHEITEAQYAAFTGDSANTSNLPVTDVTWMEAAAYCHWLSIQEGLEPFYVFEKGQLVGIDKSARGYRLLTEAEWEWLAKVSQRRASTTFSWGSQETLPKEYGNYADESVKADGKFTFDKYDDGFTGKAPVGSFKADRAGLYDMDGNVSEWVHDRFTLLLPDTQQVHLNYLGMNRGEGHVVKGGNYESGRFRELRVAKRDEGTEASASIGFRLARYD